MIEPPLTCNLCLRLADFRAANKIAYPTFFNAPVPAFGNLDARVLIVGLAPGLKGANKTGRPFTGDYAGDLLYPALLATNFAEGTYQARPDDGLKLRSCRITNAVRCVPPKNKPITEEVQTCRDTFFKAELAAMPNLQEIVALGRIAHDCVLAALGYVRAHYAFGHNKTHYLCSGLRLTDSYHCSRYNTNTGRLTAEMFHDMLHGVAARLT